MSAATALRRGRNARSTLALRAAPAASILDIFGAMMTTIAIRYRRGQGVSPAKMAAQLMRRPPARISHTHAACVALSARQIQHRPAKSVAGHTVEPPDAGDARRKATQRAG